MTLTCVFKWNTRHTNEKRREKENVIERERERKRERERERERESERGDKTRERKAHNACRCTLFESHEAHGMCRTLRVERSRLSDYTVAGVCPLTKQKMPKDSRM